jgi:hypothetical protein
MIKVTQTRNVRSWDVQRDDGMVSTFMTIYMAFGDGVRDRIMRYGPDTVTVIDHFGLSER